jgi:FG-GAP repeat
MDEVEGGLRIERVPHWMSGGDRRLTADGEEEMVMSVEGTDATPASQAAKKRAFATVPLAAALALAGLPAGAVIPPGESSLSAADVRLMGEAAGQAGFHVDQAGDLDDDGFQDVIVGAFLDPTTGPSAGAAYVLYGPVAPGVIDLGEDADAKLLAELTGDFAAEGFAGIGDMDGDGFDDFVIGAPGRFPPGQPGIPAPGAAYLFYGREERISGTMSLAGADAKLVGESNVDFAGLAVAGATDLDDDGFTDLVVSASRDPEGGSAAGAVYVIYGGEERLSGTMSLAEADTELVGAPGDLAGFRLDRAGDLDGDGSEDLVIGAPAIPGFGGSGVASTYVLYGKRQRLSGMVSLPQTAARLVGEEPDDRPGFGLTGAGDLDRDGFDDLVVGADLEDTGGLNAGAAYVFYGGQERLAGTVSLGMADAKLIGQAAGDRAGLDVSIAGDLDDDGFDELVVGAFGHDAAGTDAGAVYVFFIEDARLSGSLSLSTAPTKLLGEAAGDSAGSAVGPAGDVTDDDTDDLMVGARFNDVGGTNAGAVYLPFGVPEACGQGHEKNVGNPGHGGSHACDQEQ